MVFSVLQIRRGKRDNLGIIFHITPLKHMLRPSLEPSRRDGSNEVSQHMFSLRNKKIIFIFNPPLPSYLELCTFLSNDSSYFTATFFFFFFFFHLHYSSDFAAFSTFTVKAYCHVLSNRVAAEVVNNLADRYRYELNL